MASVKWTGLAAVRRNTVVHIETDWDSSCRGIPVVLVNKARAWVAVRAKHLHQSSEISRFSRCIKLTFGSSNCNPVDPEGIILQKPGVKSEIADCNDLLNSFPCNTQKPNTSHFLDTLIAELQTLNNNKDPQTLQGQIPKRGYWAGIHHKLQQTFSDNGFLFYIYILI